MPSIIAFRMVPCSVVAGRAGRQQLSTKAPAEPLYVANGELDVVAIERTKLTAMIRAS